MDFHDAANLDVFCLAILQLIFAMRDYLADTLVFGFILVTSFSIFESVLYHRKADHAS